MNWMIVRLNLALLMVGGMSSMGVEPAQAAWTLSQDNKPAVSTAEAHAWADAAFAKPGIAASSAEKQPLGVGAGRRLIAPFSFKYDGKTSDEFLDGWTFATEVTSTNNINIRTNTYKDPKTGLVIQCEIKTYLDFAAVDWVFRLANHGSTDTPVIEDFMPLDSGTLFGNGIARGPATLRWCNGDRYRDDLQPDAASFLLHDETLEPNKPRSFSSNVTFKYLPYFNIQVPHEGWIIAVGWTGLWKADFAQDSKGGIYVRAGMQKTHFRLKPGESVRTPSMVLMHWAGENMIVGHNQFRKLVFAHYCQGSLRRT